MSKLKIGLQLYSIRDKMEQDMDAALKQVSQMGYECVEPAGYFGKSAEQMAEMFAKYNLECISVHQALDFYLEKGKEAMDFVKTLGAKYTAIPWYEAAKLKSDFDGVMKLFCKMGKELGENGLKLLYHNHDFEFEKLDGQCIIDKMYQTVSAEYLNPEFDTCWVKYAGYEPTEYLARYAGRINVVHIKDFWAEKLANGPVYALIDNTGKEIKKTTETKRDFEFRPVGSGIQDVKAIMEASEKAGAEYVIVEQDNWYENDSLDCAKSSREYLKSIGY